MSTTKRPNIMSSQTENLGGRLPLLDPKTLSAGQKEVYDLLNKTMIPWTEKSGFQSTTEGGKFIGPFNPILFAPASARLLSSSRSTRASTRA